MSLGLVAFARPKLSIKEKSWLWASVLLAVIAAVHLALTGIPWGVVYGPRLWVGNLFIFAQLDLIASSFFTASPDASALQSTPFRDTTSLTHTGLLLGAAAAAFRKTAKVVVSSISLQTGIILVVSGFVMGGAARFACG